MKTYNTLDVAYGQLLHGNLSVCTPEFVQWINTVSVGLCTKAKLNKTDLKILDIVIKICNVLYNNTSMSVLPIEDGIYDMLMVKARTLIPNYTVGAQPTKFISVTTDTVQENKPGKIDLFAKVDFDTEGMLYYDTLRNKRAYPLFNNLINDGKILTKRMRTTSHKYPELVGTLDKATIVLNSEAMEMDVFDNPAICIFERDFLHKNINLCNPNYMELIIELKYDGVSVEAEIEGDHIISARTRGDTNMDKATDLTPVLGGYRFPNANPNTEKFGMKFEAIITKFNMDILKREMGKSYVSARNAIIGILSNSKARDFAKYITLVPLAMSSPPEDRVVEIEFMNRYYCTGEPLRYCVVTGNYNQILFQVHKFSKEAKAMRSAIPLLYDGIVVSYRDPMIRKSLGRVNSVNKYSIAVKFDANSKYTRVRNIEYTVGANGDITPMIYYDPVEFLGGINTKSSGHSLGRFKELNLKPNDIVLATYRNDVMVYISKPENIEENLMNNNAPFQFPTVCPVCGTPLLMSDKNARCPMMMCKGRAISRAVNMVEKLGIFKGFNEESIKALGIDSFISLYLIDCKRVLEILGQANGMKFVDCLNVLKTKQIPDYILLGSLGFSGVSATKWATILNEVRLSEICHSNEGILYNRMNQIKGIGPKTIKQILNDRKFFMNDLLFIEQLPNLVSTIHSKFKNTSGTKVRFSGIRDDDLVNLLQAKCNISSTAGLTKDTTYLLVPYVGYTSTKVQKALEYNSQGADIRIIPIEEFKDNLKHFIV